MRSRSRVTILIKSDFGELQSGTTLKLNLDEVEADPHLVYALASAIQLVPIKVKVYALGESYEIKLGLHAWEGKVEIDAWEAKGAELIVESWKQKKRKPKGKEVKLRLARVVGYEVIVRYRVGGERNCHGRIRLNTAAELAYFYCSLYKLWGERVLELSFRAFNLRKPAVIDPLPILAIMLRDIMHGLRCQPR